MSALHRTSDGNSTVLLAILAAACLCIAPTNSFAADTEKVLASFSGQDGANPQGGVIFDSSGNLYGTTFAGGDPSCKAAAGCGTVFQLLPNANGTWRKRVIHRFTGSDGSNPFGALLMDANRNLYGTTNTGGSASCTIGSFKGCGVVFQMSPGANGTWTFKVIHRFSATGTDGSFPTSTLIFDSVGNLYGTTSGGSTNAAGAVFELSPAVNGTWAVKTLHAFTGANGDGASPEGSLVFDTAGNLYGTTYHGGTSGTGSVFQLSPTTGGNWTATTLFSFGHVDGTLPSSGVILDSAGNLYGTTTASGGTCGCQDGTVFELVRGSGGTWTETTLHTFLTADGHAPLGLVFDTSGNLYGPTFVGGTANDGTTNRNHGKFEGNAKVLGGSFGKGVIKGIKPRM